MTSSSTPRAVVIGGGPAGLMAAERIAAAGFECAVYDAMPSVGRKFLLAGVGGLNITHSEPWPAFVARYGERAGVLRPWLDAFDNRMLCDWVHALGVDTFVGSSGKVFPSQMKAAPLLRAWLARLRGAGVTFHPRARWQGWADDGALLFDTPAGRQTVTADAVVLALGGGSWKKLGSDGAWVGLLGQAGVAVAPLAPANCGFERRWSDFLLERFAGEAVKSVGLAVADADGKLAFRRAGFVISRYGVEGGGVYALSARLRDAIARDGHATLWVDLLPDFSPERVAAEVARPRGARSLASHLQSRLGLKGARMALVHECLDKAAIADPARLAAALKALPVTLDAPRPLDEAISSAGGVRFDELDGQLMLRKRPGVFCAGEMLDWEAPTGGYLLTACFATGRAAGDGAARFLSNPG